MMKNGAMNIKELVDQCLQAQEHERPLSEIEITAILSKMLEEWRETDRHASDVTPASLVGLIFTIISNQETKVLVTKTILDVLFHTYKISFLESYFRPDTGIVTRRRRMNLRKDK